MAVKLFIEPGGTVTMSCAQCSRTKTLNASRFMDHTKVKVKCPCGHVSIFELEKRRHYRKQTDLRGTYRVIHSESSRPDSGVMTVTDISRHGVCMKFNSFPVVAIGDIIGINFHLDDKNRSLVDREVMVQNIRAPYIGAKFQHSSSMDNVIGFYLFK